MLKKKMREEFRQLPVTLDNGSQVSLRISERIYQDILGRLRPGAPTYYFNGDAMLELLDPPNDIAAPPGFRGSTP